MAIGGASIAVATPVLNCLKAVSNAPPSGSIAYSVILWGVAIAGVWAIGIAHAMHHEYDMWNSLISGLGTPTLLIALITLPQLVI
jgi:hypothetical protein